MADNDTLRAALRELLIHYREAEAGLISFGGQKRPDDMSRYEALAAAEPPAVEPPAVEWRGYEAYATVAGPVLVGVVGRGGRAGWWWELFHNGGGGEAVATEAEARAAVERAVMEKS